MILVLMISTAARAGDAVGPIGAIWASPTSAFVMFEITDSSATYQRCNESQRFSIDLRQLGGDASYQLLLLAKREDYRVQVESLNTCNPFDAENIRNLKVL